MSAKKRRAAAAAKQQEKAKLDAKRKLEKRGTTTKNTQALRGGGAARDAGAAAGVPSWFQASPTRVSSKNTAQMKGQMTNSGVAELEELKKRAIASKLETLKTQSFRLNCSLRAQLSEVKRLSGKHVSTKCGITRQLTPEQLASRKRRVRNLLGTIKKKNFFTELMPILREKGPKIWACDRVNLYQVNPETATVDTILANGTVLQIPLGKDLVGMAATARGPIVNVRSAPGESNYLGMYDEACNYLSASIVVSVVRSAFGEPLGVLELLNKKLGRFDVQDEQIVRKIGKSLAMYLK